MGSRLSKAARPHRKVAPVPVAAAHPHDKAGEGANETGSHNDTDPPLPNKLARDDGDTPTTTTNLQRCNSAPPARAATSADMDTRSQRGALSERGPVDWSSVFAEVEAMAPVSIPPVLPGSLELEAAASSSSSLLSRTPKVGPAEEPEIQCLTCCKSLPKPKDPKYATEVTRPCKYCESPYCIACVRDMFLKACKDSARMPPRCCTQIHLHQARRYLTAEEVTTFKLKYEEWSTPNPFYCPAPACSTFIPERLLPARRNAEGKRTDSGVGTPTGEDFSCQTCETAICVGCRQIAHPGSICAVTEFGIDAETSALLKIWGYKKCPKCGHGLKRMYGCSHMECRCGAHFCWVCLSSQDECDGRCRDDESVHSEDESEPDDIANGDAQSPPIADGETQDSASSTVDENAPATLLEALPFAVVRDSTVTDPSTRPAEPAQSAVRPRNLDGGSHRYWEDQDMDFGDEPSEDIQDRSWNCEHSFATYKIKFAKALSNDLSSADMECTRCWNSIHPEIITPKASSQARKSPVTIPRRHEATGHPIQRTRRRQRRWDVGAQGSFLESMTAETVSRLSNTASPLSQSVPAREPSPMEDVQYSDQVVDTYGNVVSPTEQDTPRRSSVDTPNPIGKSASIGNKTSDIFVSPAPAFSLAYECRNCALLVCQSCKTASLSTQEEDEPA